MPDVNKVTKIVTSLRWECFPLQDFRLIAALIHESETNCRTEYQTIEASHSQFLKS